MLKIGLIGVGFMGRTHLENYLRLEQEGLPIQLTAICDMDVDKLNGNVLGGNIETTSATIDFARFKKYTSVNEMLEQEQLDCVDITLPTYLHQEMSVLALNRGLHVLCEKPMALNAKQCADMKAAAELNGKQLLIGQCLRYWPAYTYLKQLVEENTYGHVLAASFFRGGGTPAWAAWLTQKEKSGGAIMDMHVHDTDIIHWLFWKPQSVSCHANNVVPGSGYDIVSTHYSYGDGKVVNAQADWTLQGDYGFEMSYRVNFERGNVVFQGFQVKVNPNDSAGFVPELSSDMGYYYQQKYFVSSLLNDQTMTVITPESAMGTIEIVEAEIQSADRQGAWTKVV